MITASDSFNTVDLGAYFAILPTGSGVENDARSIETGKGYGSGTNSNFLSMKQVRNLIKEYVDPGFKVE